MNASVFTAFEFNLFANNSDDFQHQFPTLFSDHV